MITNVNKMLQIEWEQNYFFTEIADITVLWCQRHHNTAKIQPKRFLGFLFKFYWLPLLKIFLKKQKSSFCKPNKAVDKTDPHRYSSINKDVLSMKIGATAKPNMGRIQSSYWKSAWRCSWRKLKKDRDGITKVLSLRSVIPTTPLQHASVRCIVGNYSMSFNWSKNYYLFGANNWSSYIYVTVRGRTNRYSSSCVFLQFLFMSTWCSTKHAKISLWVIWE